MNGDPMHGSRKNTNRLDTRIRKSQRSEDELKWKIPE